MSELTGDSPDRKPRRARPKEGEFESGASLDMWRYQHTTRSLRMTFGHGSDCRLRPAGTAMLGLTICAALLAGLGCPSQERVIDQTVRYDPPALHKVQAAAVFDESMERVWDRIERGGPAASFRVIVAERDTPFLVVELELPEGRSVGDFVDCGFLTRRVTIDEESQEFAYAMASSGRDREVLSAPDHFQILNIDRRVGLSVRSTLYLKRETDQRTRLTANSRYVVSIEKSGKAQLFPRDASSPPSLGSEFEPIRLEVPFTSFTPGTIPDAPGYSCRSTGEFERMLLRVASADQGVG